MQRNLKHAHGDARIAEISLLDALLEDRHALSGGNCPLDIYLNGAASVDTDLEKLRASEFAGVEYYAGGAAIPTQYNRTGSSCGVILLWTRER